MDTEIREWISMIWEYCQEHWAVVAAAAVVLLILVISFFLVCTARREDANAKAQADELSAPEHESKPASDAAEVESSDEAEVQTEPVDPLVADAEIETTTAEPALTTAEPSAETATTVHTDEPQQQVAAEQKPMQAALTDAMMKQLMRQVEEVSAASGQKVESIELNIEKARLTIRYAEGSAEESDGVKPQPKCNFELQNSGMSGAGARDSAGARDFAEKSGNGDGVETRAGDETSGGDEQTEESVMPRKFSMENMNRAKSGRVYTEDELLSQIKD